MRRTRLGGDLADADRIDWTDPGGHRPRSDERMLSRWRRVAATGATGAAVVVLAVAALAWWNPLRYVHLMTSTHDWHPLAVLAAGVVMLMFAGWLGLRSSTAVRATFTFGTLALLTVASFAALADVAHEVTTLDPGKEPYVVAVSPEGRYEITVVYPGDLIAADTAVVRVRSRNGLLSRESTDLGCIRPANSEPAVLTVAFTGSYDITVNTNDGRSWQAGFDPHTLRPTVTFGLPCP